MDQCRSGVSHCSQGLNLWAVIPFEMCLKGTSMIQIVHHRHFRVLIDENSSKQNCGGKKKAMLAYGVIQISATVVSAISLAAIAFGFVAMKQEMRSETYQSRN